MPSTLPECCMHIYMHMPGEGVWAGGGGVEVFSNWKK